MIPVTNLKYHTLLLDISRQAPEFLLKDGQFNNGIEGYSIKIDDRSRDGETFYGVMIYDHTRNSGNSSLTLADSCQMQVTKDGRYLIARLFHGFSYSEQPDGGKGSTGHDRTFRRDEFSMQQLLFSLPGSELTRSGEDTYRNYYKMLTISQLADTARAIENEIRWIAKTSVEEVQNNGLFRFDDPDVKGSHSSSAELETVYPDLHGRLNTLQAEEKKEAIRQAQVYARLAQQTITQTREVSQSLTRWANQHWIERHRKFTLAFACIAFFLVGAPLGSIVKKGGLGTPVVISLSLFIFWYVLALVGEKWGRNSGIPVWIGMWGASFILIMSGICLTWQSDRNS